jgi:hypothetical protein
MRTDRENSGLILEELRLGRLRQGWGYDGSQDLHLLVKKRQAGEEFTSAERDAWRNRPMLGGEHGINTGDIVLVPNLPSSGEFLLLEVEGPYRFEPLKLHGETDVNGLGQDYGHILPVGKIEKPVPIPMQDEQVHAGLRGSLTCRSRLWSISDYGENVEELLHARRPAQEWDLDGAFRRTIDDALRGVEDTLEAQISEHLGKRFSRAELEVPCARILRHLFPGATVERHGGPAEHGADIVVTWEDPLAVSGSASGLSWRAVFQVKDWNGTATDTTGVDQLAVAVHHYSDEYPVRGAYLLTFCDGESETFRTHRETTSKELGLPIVLVGRSRLLSLFRTYALSRGSSDGRDLA